MHTPLKSEGDKPTGPVFVLGLPKCGTTSLQHALWSAGFGAVHCYAPKPWGPSPEDRFVGHLMFRAAREGRPPLALLPRWVNAVTQMDCWWLDYEPEGKHSSARPKKEARSLCAHGLFPQIALLKELTDAYPGAKFILNIRDARAWVRSVDTYGHLRRILTEADLPGLPRGVGGDDDDLAAWFEGHAERVRRHFTGRKACTLLEMKLEEGDEQIKARLEAFLGRELEWGRHNATTWA